MVKSMLRASFIVVATVLLPNISRARTLPDPDELHAVPTVLRTLHGVSVGDAELFLFAERLDEYVVTPFNVDGKKREDRFGAYAESERIKFPKTKYPGEWRGLLVNEEKKRVLWDASMMQLVIFNPADHKIIQEVTIPADRLRPPADRMGEPTAKETTAARAKFKAAYRKVFGVRYTGLSALPSGWMTGKKKSYVVSSKIPGYPLLVMGCAAEDPTACLMERYCYAEGGPNFGKNGPAGVAVDAKNKLLLLGDSDKKQVHIYKWESCFNIRYKRSMDLPKTIEAPTSIQIDDAERLWITTGKWENKFDSNLYYWDASQWRNL